MAEYTLYYGPLAGRGEFIRVMFEEAGVPYKDVSDPIEIVKEVRENGLGGFPAFAPPVVKKGDLIIGQTPVICRFLGKEFGMWPEKEEDIWHAEQINTTIHDFFAEGRLVFHGRGFVESYYTQKEETKPYIEWFIKDRFSKWLNYLESALALNNGGKGHVVGDKLTYVDLALLHVLRAAASQFPEPWEKLDSIPLLKAFKDRMSERPRFKAYFASDRCRPFEGNSMM